jgi:transcriptional regulator with XRE-family HTH domain
MRAALNPIYRFVGLNLRLFRIEKGLSQTTLAAAVDITFQQVKKYETGANRISGSRLFEMVIVLGAPM